MKKHNIMSGALVLTAGGVLAKIFSAIYRIILTRVLGGVGIGLYQLVFPLYSLCVVLATAGLPMAISKVVSRNQNREKSVLTKCFLFTSIVSLSLTFILFVSAKGISSLQGQPQLMLCYMILAPTIILLSFSSVIKGYFQGKHNFVPSSVSNIIEQFIKLSFGLVLSVSLISISEFAAIVGAIVAIVLSEVVSLIVLLLYIKKEKFKNQEKTNTGVRTLMRDVFPITLTNIILPISTFIDSILVVNLLSINYSKGMSVFLYGLESGAVSSLLSIPTIFSFSLASVILPSIANSTIKFNKNSKLSLVVKIVLIITIPCVLGFMLVPNRLLSCIYSNRLNSNGINGIAIAAKLLSVSSLGVLFLALNQIFSSTLQAIDERGVTIKNLIIAVVLKFIIEVLFLPSKSLNIYSLAIANLVCYVTTMTLNFFEIKENFTIKFNLIFVWKLVLSNSVMIVALVIILSLKNSIINTLLAVVVAVIVYFYMLFKTKILTRKDVAMFKYKV